MKGTFGGIILCLFIFHFFQMKAQNWTWAETAGGILPDEANGCAIDSSGNMYMCGFFFSSSINFNSGNSMSNSGVCDAFIVKYNPQGRSLWASRIKGNSEDKATACTVDKWGNVIVTGYFNSPSLQFGGNNAHTINNSRGNNGSFDAFIVKYNANGAPQWFRAIGKNDDDGGRSVATDDAGNVYVTGWFRDASIQVGGFTLHNQNPGSGTSDVFLIKYSPTGNVLWAKSFGSPDDDKGNSCIVDPDGNVIVTGYFKPDSLHVEGLKFRNNGSKDLFVVKYHSNGTLLAAKTYGGSGGDEAFDCSVDGAGNIFVCGGFFSSKIIFDNDSIVNTGGNSGVFLVKLNPQLHTLWTRSASSNAPDEARACATDKYGNTVITGVYKGNSITFGNTTLNNNGGEEIFLVKYGPAGNQLWAKKIGKSKDDGANDCSIMDNGKILVTGYYNSSTLTLGNITLDNSYVGVATSDLFIATTCAALTGTHHVTSCGPYTWIDGITYTQSNHTAAFTKANTGNTCDSLLFLNLLIAHPSYDSVYATICPNDTYVFNGTPLSVPGRYTDTLQNIYGCDSMVVLELSVHPVVSESFSASICEGDSYPFNGRLLTLSGMYADTLTAAGGCDSVVYLSLTVHPLPQPYIVQNGNELSTQPFSQYQWQLNGNDIPGAIGQTFMANQSGVYSVRVTDNHGCANSSDTLLLNLPVTGMERFSDAPWQVFLYHDAAAEMLTVTSNTEMQTLYITDLAGRHIISLPQQPSVKVQFSTASMPMGMYLVWIQSVTNQTALRRMVKP